MLGVVGSNLKMVKFEPKTPNMSQHIATRWPNALNMLRPTMLRYVALVCCDRLAGALEKKSTCHGLIFCRNFAFPCSPSLFPSIKKNYASSMSSWPEPAIWSHDAGQRILCFDSCQLKSPLQTTLNWHELHVYKLQLHSTYKPHLAATNYTHLIETTLKLM